MLFVGKEIYKEGEPIKEVLNKDEKNKIDALATEITNLEEYIEKVKKKKLEEPEDLVEEEEEEEDILQYVNVGDDKEKDKTKEKDTEDKTKDKEDKGLSVGIIAMIVIFSIVALVGICVGVWYFYIKKKNTQRLK